MTTMERIILNLIKKLYQQTRSAIRTTIVADLLAKNERVIRRVLVRLEAAGVIRRRGKRGGWLPA